MKKDISFQDLNKISKLFKEKGWTIENSNNYDSFFNRFCLRYKLLEDAENKQFYLNLSERFVIQSSQPSDICSQVLEILEDNFELLNLFSKIYITTLKKLSQGSTKSSDHILSTLKYNRTKLSKSKLNDKITLCSLDDYLIRYQPSLKINESIIIFIDDFIGSGGSAKEAIDSFMNQKLLDEKNYFSIFSLNAMQSGIDYLTIENHYDLFFGRVLKKGLSDFYNSDDLIKFKNLLEKISNFNVKIRKEYFGYKDGESLYSFDERAANNTIPLFWYEKRNKKNVLTDLKFAAPFNRN